MKQFSVLCLICLSQHPWSQTQSLASSFPYSFFPSLSIFCQSDACAVNPAPSMPLTIKWTWDYIRCVWFQAICMFIAWVAWVYSKGGVTDKTGRGPRSSHCSFLVQLGSVFASYFYVQVWITTGYWGIWEILLFIFDEEKYRAWIGFANC